MTVRTRIAFDTKLPFVVTTPDGINVGGDIIGTGETLDWRKLGISEQTLFEMWRAGLLAHTGETPEPDAETVNLTDEDADLLEGEDGETETGETTPTSDKPKTRKRRR